MKLVKIFGMVLALHVVLLTIFFLSPGCSSTPRTQATEETPTPAASSVGSQVVPASENWSSPAAMPAGAIDRSSSVASAPPITGLTPAERARAQPTRPDDSSAFFGPAAGSTSSGSAPVQAPSSAQQSSAPATYTVVAGDSLWKISRKFGVTIPELQKANPAMRGNSLKPGDVLNVPASASAAAPSSSALPSAGAQQAVTSAASTATYVVRSGDSLSKIAARNGTTIAALRSANGLTTDTIQIGQQLVIPAGAGGATPTGAASTASAQQPVEGLTVVVQSGETLGELARRFDVTVADLMKANNITDSRRVRAGQVLVIPGFQPVGGGVVPNVPQTRTPAPRTTPPPATTAPAVGPAPQPTPVEPEPVEPAPIQTAPFDLDQLVPADAPIVPIDEPVPQP
ncbi:LysM peptidoglycan-binding domain-containing protein [Congregicoccus parvus]|uniref:LysM peptidoglycan-binding domain-containing protein n=1 Tax=Congregicoccus parvus TaxID=3081749 RepID=UPI003FA5C760